MWMKVFWCGDSVTAWVPSIDLWETLCIEPMPDSNVVLSQVVYDGPYRWLFVDEYGMRGDVKGGKPAIY